ncbi:hypothetical protein H0H81_004425 [Sphagnurus paluster]|uniref:Uncharacterized protein n=1 Tax=Sphagnurus paluster TaxID=117069 RepID=A0A9P7GMM3_9AGAR|nr:hypothetical protein H0H81_004425 [Sphagnurus paluster]
MDLASSDNRIARTLRLVSRYANVWVLPLLFRTLTFTSPDQVMRVASTLLPKRRIHIPALKSNLHTFPRVLSSYTIESLALVVNNRLPSVEIALAKIAPAFTQLKNLVISSSNLSANAHWLRQHPIYPTNIMILHFGSPCRVNYRDPVFQHATHLYVSSMEGHRNSFVTDAPQLTHLAMHTRITHPFWVMTNFATIFLDLLKKTPRLELFVFVLNSDDIYDPKIDQWTLALSECLQDQRFVVLPHFRHPRMEWERMLSGKDSIWDCALTWRALLQGGHIHEILRYRTEMAEELRAESELLSAKKYAVDWEIDLVQREGYLPYQGDLTERREAARLY